MNSRYCLGTPTRELASSSNPAWHQHASVRGRDCEPNFGDPADAKNSRIDKRCDAKVLLTVEYICALVGTGEVTAWQHQGGSTQCGEARNDWRDV
jgi:hypothetical protein